MLAAAGLLLAAPAFADDPLPRAEPAEAGLSDARLERLTAVVRADVEKGRIPGVVMLVARDGRLAHLESVGWRDKEKQAPMRPDAIFRIYSMTKPIVSVAAMMLWEEGRFLLADPVSKFIPEFKDLKVGVEKTDPATGKTALELVPAGREMTVHDLLRHTSGLTYGVFGKSLVKQAYLDADVPSKEQTNEELIGKLAKLPLAYQPGTTWEYSRSTDVLGRLVEVISGQTLDVFLQERVLGPLGMRDTGFHVPPEKLDRLAEPLSADPDTGKPVRLINVRAPQKFLSGGGGMVSTAADYVRFVQMLLNGGELDGVRILARKTVAYMLSDHLGEIRGPAYSPGPGYGFGLGVGVRLEPGLAAVPGSVGDFYWGGLGGTYFWGDPKERLIAVWMMQAPGQRNYYRALFRDLVYSAIVE